MPNVMEMRNLKNKVSRNGFDLSRNILMSTRVGEITPFYCKLVMPGDNFELYPSHYSRTQPLNTAAYAKIKESINFFKVPFHLLYNLFDTIIVDMLNNPQVASSLTSSQTLSDKLPFITEYQLAQCVYTSNRDKIKDELGYLIAPRLVKHLQYLGYGDYSAYLTTAPAESIQSRRLSPFPLLAYQKVYYDYFRYSQWEDSSPWCFNINWVNYPVVNNFPINILELVGAPSRIEDSLLTPRYANFKKDYFLGVLPSPQYGDSSVVPVVSPPSGNIDGPGVYTTNSSPASWPGPGNNFIGKASSLQVSQLINRFVNNPSVLSIRKAEAIQKLREIQQSGNQDYKEQIEKIFGVTMSDDKSDLCTWLGGYDSDIQISEVVNQSLNGDDSANIKGKGTSSSGTKISFQSDDYYLVIGVYVATPKLYYDISAPHHEQRMVTSDDFPNPILDRIGMESVPFADLFGFGAYPNIATQSSFLGYAPRYYKYKTWFDEVLGAFKKSSNSNLQSWVAPYSDFTNMLVQSDKLYSSYLMFKVNPNILNPIMNVQVNQETESLTNMNQYWNSEQFLVNMSIGCAAVRPLDYDGLPYT